MNEDEFYRELGLRVQRARRKIGLTQEGLASLISLGRTSVVNIEKGRQKVLAHTLSALTRALRTTPNELLPATTQEMNAIDRLLKDASKPAQSFVRSVMASALRNKGTAHADSPQADQDPDVRASREVPSRLSTRARRQDS